MLVLVINKCTQILPPDMQSLGFRTTARGKHRHWEKEVCDLKVVLSAKMRSKPRGFRKRASLL